MLRILTPTEQLEADTAIAIQQSIESDIHKNLINEAESLQSLLSSLCLSDEEKTQASERLCQLYAQIASFQEDKSVHIFTSQERAIIVQCYEESSGSLKFILETVFNDIYDLGMITQPVSLPDGHIYQDEHVRNYLGNASKKTCPFNQEIEFAKKDIIPCKTLINALKIIVDKRLSPEALTHALIDALCKDRKNKIIRHAVITPDGYICDRTTAIDSQFKETEMIPCYFIATLVKQFEHFFHEEKSEEKQEPHQDSFVSEITALLKKIQNPAPEDKLLVNQDMEIVLQAASLAVQQNNRDILLEAMTKHPGYNKIPAPKTSSAQFSLFCRSMTNYFLVRDPPGVLVGEKIQETIQHLEHLMPKSKKPPSPSLSRGGEN